MKTLDISLRNRLLEFIIEDNVAQALDDARDFIVDAIADGYTFKGYNNLTDEELVQEFKEQYLYDENVLLELDTSTPWGRELNRLVQDLTEADWL
jgi:hypothetical protein